MLIGIAVVVSVLIVAGWLFRPQLQASPSWRATVTPLASIIGSGFLVVTPLLASAVGSWAPVAMSAIALLAYWVGSAVRFTIAEVEPRLSQNKPPRALADMEWLSRLLLGFAYVISVAFYLRLMASFVLSSLGGGEVAAQMLATAVLIGIGTLGWLRGLHGLEVLEEIAVSTKLAIIAGLLVGFVLFNVADVDAVIDAYRTSKAPWSGWTTIRVLAGMIVVVQGFETSRYLAAHYDPSTRIRSMRYAQWLSSAIYVVFVALSVRLHEALPAQVDETAILDAAGEVTSVLVPLLIIAAIASQLSAAVADTAGGGEMLAGSSRKASSSGIGYVALTGAATAVVWLADVFAIVSLASRAFAAYYLLQTIMAMYVLATDPSIANRGIRLAGFGLLLAVLGFVVIFAIPADS